MVVRFISLLPVPSQLDLRGTLFLVRFLRMCLFFFFFNPPIEVATFRLGGYIVAFQCVPVSRCVPLFKRPPAIKERGLRRDQA